MFQSISGLYPEELKKIHEDYKNDPRRRILLMEKEHIINIAQYEKAIISTEGLKIVYAPHIQKRLDSLDDHLKDIEREYSARLMKV